MKANIKELNAKYSPLTPDERIHELYKDFSPNEIMITSSFGTSSILLLHIINSINPQQKVHFLDTSFHFPETLKYKETLKQLYKLDVVDIKPDEYQISFTKKEKVWKSDPDLCCAVNKVGPLASVKSGYKIWISGLMQNQNNVREDFGIFQEADGIIKFHPLIDLTEEEKNKIIKENNLPEHPLFASGYESVGCTHCTIKGKGRSGRWSGKLKTECGLHSKPSKPKE
ncbi:phosphoadenylyl-sulfate reductase [Labilibaculum sp. DW002]|uniref:Adenosine 5'-phosphosulfate reductase n=1 Tax=Paralabilibaculum antarcticum TaxID=2912572 RepID=A0ABT5VQ74_9BACT|nr:phosphoadenylyl-sulfate reductase [Labilibaculum sp. DW002]MDE5417578.1 phosphoadenylyl-sulfate reductase [Labilibaculum sp. DW002]